MKLFSQEHDSLLTPFDTIGFQNCCNIVLQPNNTKEVRTISQYARLNDILFQYVEDLDIVKDVIDWTTTLAVGSVEYIKPLLSDYQWRWTYPDILEPYLFRKIRKMTKGDRCLIKEHAFVKPQETKLFTGFVLGEDYDEEVIFNSLPDDTWIWSSEVVDFETEYRVYVKDKKILGNIQWYLTKDEDNPAPLEMISVQRMIELFDCPHPYAMDVGVLSTGETALVEVNDAWAIGLYEGSLTPKEYFDFLWERWITLIPNRVL